MYETETEYTFEECKKLQNHLFIRNLYVHLIIGMLVVMMVLRSHSYYGIIVFLLYLLALALQWYIQNRKVKKECNSAENVKRKYIFFENYFEEENNMEKKYIYYHDIEQIIETKTDLYIRIARHKWIIIKKCNSSNELLNLIRKYKTF